MKSHLGTSWRTWELLVLAAWQHAPELQFRVTVKARGAEVAAAGGSGGRGGARGALSRLSHDSATRQLESGWWVVHCARVQARGQRHRGSGRCSVMHA